MIIDKTIKVGTAVLVFNDKGHILMGKRQGSHGANSWAVIGGYIEFGEDFTEAAQREIKEEIGVEVTDISVLLAKTYFFEDNQKHHISIYVAARLTSGVPVIQEPHKMLELKWIEDWDDLPSPLFVPYHEAITADMITNYRLKYLNLDK
jgi:8-oxo-dGTP diphosphatase